MRRLRTVGRLAFGTAILAFGVISLAYTDFVSSLQPVPASVPGYGGLALLSGLALAAGGGAIAVGRGVRAAGLLLSAFLASWILFLHVPSAFLEPALLRSPWWIRTFETLIFASAALILATDADPLAPRQRIDRARIAIGLSLPVFGVLHLVYPASVAALIPPWYPLPMFWAYFTGFAQIAAGLAIATGVLSRLAATAAGLMYGLWALTLHTPRNWCRLYGPCEAFPDLPLVEWANLRPELTSLFVAVGMCGAAWTLAGTLACGPGTAGEPHDADRSPADRAPVEAETDRGG
jgi:uncharacterized membrane protein YphA (DoxX/SURF4 family)